MSLTKRKSEPATVKKDKLKATADDNKAVVQKSVGNYEKHPFFIKKANAAKEFLKKAGLPQTARVKTS